MYLKSISIILVSMITLSACTVKKIKTHPADVFVYDQLTKQAITLKVGQDELYRAGVINRTPMRFPEFITHGKRNISLDWQGDARELLAELAKRQNKQFKANGVALPLPININVENATYFSLISMIKEQTGYRAEIKEGVNEIQLNYTPKWKIDS